jgi:hypothetical protein
MDLVCFTYMLFFLPENCRGNPYSRNFIAKKEAQGLKKTVQTQQLNNYKPTRGLKAGISSRSSHRVSS